ncbi:MarR family winged helix-turn-helix transcriptional regulator [Hasllibacter sp. MH4015]|uniref:MarR family winged helix-turn-helix transcriptional regulator n=1 Tax=Hasllibacter sp. MH4015 TaxID=2854029 RepID=UPI001CD1E10F|nr:MarR family winged helix-turn-helix transcriptional regulator [Hasllibacter sp. MH4015]
MTRAVADKAAPPRDADAASDRPVYDADLRRLIGYNIQRASSAIMGAVNAVLTPFELRRASYSVLSVIVGQPGLRQADLSEVLAIERPNLVQIVDMLEKAGWITRRRADMDRRAYELHPTPAGADHYARARAALEAFDTRMTCALSDEALAALTKGLNAVERAGPGARAATEDAEGLP